MSRVLTLYLKNLEVITKSKIFSNTLVLVLASCIKLFLEAFFKIIYGIHL